MSNHAEHLDELALSDLLDGQADSSATEHLAGCASCQAELSRWQSVTAQVGASPPDPPPGVFEGALSAAHDVWARPAPGQPRRRWGTWAAAAAAAAAAVAIGVGVASSGGGSSSKPSAGPAITAPPETFGGGSGSSGAASGGAAQPEAEPSVDGPAELRAVLNAPQASDAQSTQTNQGCAAAAAPHPGAVAELSEAVVYQGHPAVAFVYPSGRGRVAVVVADAGCRILAKVTL